VVSAIALSAVLSGLVALPAAALTWYSAASPLTAYEGTVAQAQAYGNFYNYNSTYARSNSTQRDNRPGGDSIYVETTWYFLVQQGSLNLWTYDNKHQTARTSSSTWSAKYTQDPLRIPHSQVRGAIVVCEDQFLSGDPCSATVIKTFSY
jgi:hypothetical protein